MKASTEKNVNPAYRLRLINIAERLESKSATLTGAIHWLHRLAAAAMEEKIPHKIFAESTTKMTAAGWRARQTLRRGPAGSVVTLPDKDIRTTRAFGFFFAPLADPACAARAAAEIGTCGQRSNRRFGQARIGLGQPHVARFETFRYKGNYRGYTGSMLYWDYQSCVGVSSSGRSAVVVQECKLVRRILAPAGMRWVMSDGAMLQRMSDGMDYHPTLQDFKARNFAGRVRKAMSANWMKRQATQRAELEAAKEKEIFTRQVQTTRVTLEDSRRAGNCVEGSLRYAEERLHIPRQTVLDAGYLFSVSAATLLRVNGSERVTAAVRAAWMRETTVSI